MAKVSQSVLVNAPAQKIFEQLADPARAVTFVPGLNRITNVAPPEPKVGRTWEFEFDWFGLVISGQSRCSRHDEPAVYQFETLTGSKSTWTYRCEPRDGKTQLTLEVEYEISKNLLARFATQAALESMNQNRAREVVANLKALVEP